MKSNKFLALFLALALIAGFGTSQALADSASLNFEGYALGPVNGQDGWSMTGPYDVAVVANTYGYPAFGGQSLRISNAVTSGSFGDQTFSKSLTDEAGETSAVSNGLSGGTRQSYFEAQWDFASARPNLQQAGLSVTASPDRGDGARMSWIQMADTPTGLEVNFYDYQESAVPAVCDDNDFVFTNLISGLDRTTNHTIKVQMYFVDGAANDVVQVSVDGTLLHTGTSWEDYFLNCEGNPTRPVDSILFRTGGTAAPATAGNGFLIDNLTLFSASDDQGPITTNILASPNPAAVNSSVSLTANVDDTATGGSNIASAESSLDGGATWSSTLMAASDGAFDEVSEDVTANITAPSTPGIYNLCVRGTDTPGNVGDPECTMFVVYDPSGGFVTGGGWIDSPAGAVAPIENIVYFNGFETDINGWLTPTRVMSGNNGIPSASGSYHAEATGDFTRWGGYNSVFPTNGFITSIDIYLNMDGAYANDTRFDWTSAISAPDGNHRRDFIFNGGFYNDATGPGAGQNRFVFSASNNTPGWPKNPGRDPIAVTTTGWYTLQHHFYDSGTGVLAVDLSILDASGNVIHTWTLSDPTDIIGTTVGGNRYGWFATNGFPFLAIDNSVRKEFSNITGKATFGFVSKYKKGATIPDGNTEFQFTAGGLNFHSTSYDWLVVNQAGTNAQFKGTGTINGQGSYKFQLWAGDGSPDTFRIKIWYEVGSTEVVVYDNGMNQPIGGGSIVVHKK